LGGEGGDKVRLGDDTLGDEYPADRHAGARLLGHGRVDLRRGTEPPLDEQRPKLDLGHPTCSIGTFCGEIQSRLSVDADSRRASSAMSAADMASRGASSPVQRRK